MARTLFSTNFSFRSLYPLEYNKPPKNLIHPLQLPKKEEECPSRDISWGINNKRNIESRNVVMSEVGNKIWYEGR
jgi:hypothetical protein